MDELYFSKYLKYKRKYLLLRNQLGSDKGDNISLLNLNRYKLIGIGEFAHGIEDSWKYRFDVLKQCIEKTNQNVTIFNEMSIWQAQNIMNNTIWDRQYEKFVPYDGIKIEKPVHNSKNESAWGKLWQYVSHTSESQIVLEIIKYIRKYKDRITLIGVDNDTLSRDYDMFKIIKKNLNKDNINFFWAHNAHVDDRELSWDNYKWTKDKYPNLKWYCGHYLKKEYDNKYCIILSTAYKGNIRFNGYCQGDGCEKRTWLLKYFTKEFLFKKNKKYVDQNKNYQLLQKYHGDFIEFSNSYYKDNLQGYQSIINSKTWDYILFWNDVTKLESYFDY